jgi:hypothetical protein
MKRAGKIILATGAIGGLTAGYLFARSGQGRAEEADRGANGIEPSPGPVVVPLAEPVHRLLRCRINTSHEKDWIVQEPATVLLTQARRFDPDVTMDELTGARLAASEHGSGTFTELACIVDSELNRAERDKRSLFESLTVGGKFGRQGRAKDGNRPAATRKDPTMRHLLAARAVLSGKVRGVSRGAIRFFDPKDADKQHRTYKEWDAGGRKGKKVPIVSCGALDLLEAWSFDYGKKGRKKGGNRCPPDRSRKGKHTQAWIGPIDGVDPFRLMLMIPMQPGPEHQRRYEAARELLQRRLEKVA